MRNEELDTESKTRIGVNDPKVLFQSSLGACFQLRCCNVTMPLAVHFQHKRSSAYGL